MHYIKIVDISIELVWILELMMDDVGRMGWMMLEGWAGCTDE